ncbi:MAG: hypothetical protein AB3X41_01935 [Leptothrix ochracea]|uniref:hypothetical protein n=1 Tax=Leptothrix ochracea TaxID=735331 RepID=UPI0034E1B4E2
MATPNYSYEKRQRELAKKRKTEEKKQRKLHKPDGSPADDSGQQDPNHPSNEGTGDVAAAPNV